MITTEPPPLTAPRRPVTPPPSSLLKQIGEILSQHLQIALLEGRFELIQGVKRAAVFALSAFLGLTVYCLLQVALVHGLVAAGLPLWGACLILCAVYGAGIAYLLLKVGRRPSRVGGPFEASREEWQRSREWMRKRFF